METPGQGGGLRTLKLGGNERLTDGAVCSLLPSLAQSRVERVCLPPGASAGTRQRVQQLCAANRTRNGGSRGGGETSGRQGVEGALLTLDESGERQSSSAPAAELLGSEAEQAAQHIIATVLLGRVMAQVIY